MTAPNLIPMDVATTAIDGLLVLTQKQISDDRGTVREFYRESAYAEPLAGIGPWRQVNVTYTGAGAIRGLHGEPTTKLVGCIAGEAFGAYLDAREDSATFGTVVTVALGPGTQVLVPAGVCNGFQAVSPEGCQYLYCFSEEWVPGVVGSAFHPLSVGIDWPIGVDESNPAQLSAKDAAAPAFTTVTA